MFGKRKNELIQQSYDIESNKDNLTPEQGKNISIAAQALAMAGEYFEKYIAAEEKKKAKNANRRSYFFAVVTVMSVGAVLLLTPLKTVQPYVIRVDSNSGYTDIVRYGPDQDITHTDDAFWATAYVIQHESYNFSTQDERTKFVELTSYPAVYTEYKNFQLSKKGYLAQLADKQQMRVTIRNVSKSQLSEDKKTTTIQIRFDKTVVDDVGQPVTSIPKTTWLATVSFDYSRPPKNKAEEWISPRGFGVRAFDKTQEVGY